MYNGSYKSIALKKRTACTCLLLCLLAGAAVAQETAVRVPLEHGVLWKQEALSMEKTPWLAHTAVKPALNYQIPSDTTKHYNNWFARKLLAEDLLFKQYNNWKIRVNPLFDMRPGREFGASENALLYNYGLALNVEIDDKWAIYTEANTGWSNFPAYIDSFIRGSGVVPGQGLARTGTNPLQYQNAATYISYKPSAVFNVQIGQDRHFIGEGYRSLLLSDAAFPMPYIRSQLNLGPFQYSHWIMQLMDVRTPPLSGNLGFRKKYSAMSYLSWQVNKRLNIGAFQAVVWQADDSIGGNRAFPWQYLNPFIMYWPIQYSSGSEGNLVMALTSKLNLGKYGIFYGQFLLDELLFSTIFKNEGALANKFGGQLGYKQYQLFGRKNWFLQAEVNLVRPHTYSHWSPLTNYSHFSQPLAHPAGANFREYLVATEIPLSVKFSFTTRVLYTQLGRDTGGLALGQDIFKNFQTAPGGLQAKGIFIGNGLPASSWHVENAVSFLLNPKTNFRAEIRWIYRKEDMTVGQRTTNWIMLGIRSQLSNRYYDF